jgi:hypothetical protein
MKAIEPSLREEGLISASLNNHNDLVSLIASMINIRVKGIESGESEYRKALAELGEHICQTSNNAQQSVWNDPFSITSRFPGFVGKTPVISWAMRLASATASITEEHPLKKLFLTAGFEPKIVFEEKKIFPADHARLFLLFMSKTGIEFVFRRPV